MTMDGAEWLGRVLIVIGAVVLVTGVVLLMGPRIPLLGNLPGDIRIQRENVTVFIPLGTMLLVSVVVSLILGLLNRR